MIQSESAKRLYASSFNEESERVFYSHGRVEIIGNHTDHQGGLCLVGGCNYGITAAVKPNVDGAIRVASAGFSPFMFHLDELQRKPGEKGSTMAIAKGILYKMKAMGLQIGGFSAALTSDLPVGSGLSSSAAVEALFCKILSVLYNDDCLSPMDIARISQFAENEFFGKPCGMLDQIGVCYGGVAYLDFHDKDNIVVDCLPYTLNLKPILVNTGGTHADLGDFYASIPADMCAAAKEMFGVERLCEVRRDAFMRRVTTPTPNLSERAKLRAQHYFDECERVKEARKSLMENNPISFAQCIEMSHESSRTLLQNTYVPGEYDHSPQQAIDIAKDAIHNGGARMMGGGFAGSILCFVYPDDVEPFTAHMAQYYGKENVVPLTFEKGGPIEVK